MNEYVGTNKTKKKRANAVAGTKSLGSGSPVS